MASTVYSAFEEFASKNELTARQVSDVSTKHGGVRNCIQGALSVDRAFLIGSYARSTMIRPPKDVDLLIVLDTAAHAQEFFYAADGAQQVLDRFHAALKRCYTTTPIRKDGPAVNLDFATVGFDAVPAFHRDGGGFLIPNRPGTGWISTDPEQHAQRTTAWNIASGGYFVPLVKMFKVWNRWWYDKLTGFHLEMAMSTSWPRMWGRTELEVYDCFSGAAAALFPALASQLAWPGMTDPPGLGGVIDGYLSTEDRARTVERLRASGESARIALQHEAAGKHEWAIGRWREIFGDFFPAYS